MKIFTCSFLLFSCLFISACSDDKNQDKKTTSGDHVWKEQTMTMEKARAVEGIMEESAQEQRKMIEESVE